MQVIHRFFTPQSIVKLWVLLFICLVLVVFAANARSDIKKDATVVYRTHSRFEKIFVVDQGDYRFLRFGSAKGDDQSFINKKNSLDVPMEYIRYMTMGLCDYQNPDVAMVGLGGGSLTNIAKRLYPKSSIDAIEVDEKVIQIAKKYFGVSPGPKYRLIHADGRKFFEKTTKQYDIIALDAYGADGFPPQLTTKSYFSLLGQHLRNNGLLVANIAANNLKGECRLIRNIAAKFPQLQCFDVPQWANVVVFAKKQAPGFRETYCSSIAKILRKELFHQMQSHKRNNCVKKACQPSG